MTRIILTEDQSAILAAAGPRAFSIVAIGSYPDAPGRWVLTLAPAEWDTATAACNVLLGTHRAAKIKTANFNKTSQ